MAFFQKKTTLVHNITYMALMTAINLIFIVLDRFVPLLIFVLVFVLPFASAIVSYYCQKKYYIIYALANIALCFIFFESIFYIVPAICSGFVIGLLLEKRIHPFWMLLSSTIIEASLSIAFIPLINVVTHTDIIETTFAIFKLQSFSYKADLMYLAIFFVALTQCTITHFVLLTEIKKLGIETYTRVASFGPYIIGLQLSLIIGLILALTYSPLSHTFIAISFYFAVFLMIDIATCKKPLIYLCIGILFVVAFFLYVLMYSKMVEPLGFVWFSLFPLAVAITSFVKNYLLKYESNI